MRPAFQTLVSGKWACALLLVPTVLTGCATPKLWESDSFAHVYAPADPPNLRLFYSTNREDVLVVYDEQDESTGVLRHRSYWLGPYLLQANPERRPHFVPVPDENGLVPIPINNGSTNSVASNSLGLYALAHPHDTFITLCSPGPPADPFQLPEYSSHSQRAKQVLLTPVAVGFDAALTGSIMAVTLVPYALCESWYSFRP